MGNLLRTPFPPPSLLKQAQKLHLLPKGESNHCKASQAGEEQRCWVRVYRDVENMSPLKYPSRIMWWGGITLKLPLTLGSLH